MVIKNSAKLQRKHPNYNEEIKIIKYLVDVLVSIESIDLLELAQNMQEIDWDINIKNFFLTNQPKEIECKTANDHGGVWGFSELFQKDGFEFSTNINCPMILSVITGDNNLTGFHIFRSLGLHGSILYQVTFSLENERGSFDVESQNGQPVLIKYEINNK